MIEWIFLGFLCTSVTISHRHCRGLVVTVTLCGENSPGLPVSFIDIVEHLKSKFNPPNYLTLI